VTRPYAVAVSAALAAAIAPAGAAAAFPGTSLQRLSDAPSRNPAISQDQRLGRLAAFEADTGGTTNVYVVRRAQPFGEGGTPWRAGSTVLASRGLGGRPANGPSTQPSLDGTSRVAPHCIAFVSAASNLVRGDTNGKPDAFLYDLRSGKLRRVSVNSRGRQSSGTVTEVAVNGLCTRVAFVSDASDLALRKTRNLSWRTAVTRVNAPGRRQVYIRSLGGTTSLDRALRGLTFLASASDRGVPGDGDSHSVAFSTNSRAIVWASDARNLSSSDGNGVSDVYQRVMTRRYGPKRNHHRAQQLAMDTSLVSVASDGNAGAGPSDSPAVNVDGSRIAFATTADDLVGRAAGGVSQVVSAELRGSGAPRLRLASRTAGGAPGNGPSGAPSLTAGGTWVAFDSAATDVGVTTSRGPDTNGVRDAMISTEPSGDRWLLGEGAAEATTNPMTSPHGNYIVFERGGHAQLLYAGAK
jgi:Tol biopolymer transport system component